MTVVAGIVCEYNPFHEGHFLQINKLRREHGADVIVCAMSGHFMQRGEPAVTTKERRTMMALSCGADLVIELPALYATRSAYWFALGGVSLLAAAGITHLAFGAETDDLQALQATAERLANPDDAYTSGLQRFLRAGLPFAEAQAKALTDGSLHQFVPDLPNDRLALSYLQVAAEKQLSIKPILIPREGSAYHANTLPAQGSQIASATAIRRRLSDGALRFANHTLNADMLRALAIDKYIPEAALPYLADAQLLFAADAAPVQMALLRRANRASLLALPDMTEGLENRVLSAAARAEDLDAFYRLLKTKRYTMTRLQRMVTHLLIDYQATHADRITDGVPYLRILGTSSAGRLHLHQIKKTVPIPVITRTSRMKELIRQCRHAADSWDLELRCTAIHGLLSGRDFSGGNPEYLFSPQNI